jgi:N-acetylmuramoyl-L-alanine amidase
MSIRHQGSRLNKITIHITLTLIFLWNFYGGMKVFATPTEIDSKLILIDAGHGGMDGGAVSRRGTIEKHINLSISLKVRDKLKNLGYEVIMTRDEDKGLYTQHKDVNRMKREDLNNRCKLKRDSNCDLFISLHQNYFNQSDCHGSQVWYSRNDESKRFAHIIQENLKKDLGNNSREEKEAKDAYKILRCYTNIPSVIVECGFLTNPIEEEKLIAEEYQDAIAKSIVKSIEEYFIEDKNELS